MDLSLRAVMQESAVIVDRYRTIQPVDPQEVSAVVDAYIRLKGDLVISYTEKRMLLAICIRFFHPEKLLGTHLRRLRNGIIPALADKLGCKPNYFCDVLGEVIFQYSEYQSFKNEIETFYSKLKIILK